MGRLRPIDPAARRPPAAAATGPRLTWTRHRPSTGSRTRARRGRRRDLPRLPYAARAACDPGREGAGAPAVEGRAAGRPVTAAPGPAVPRSFRPAWSKNSPIWATSRGAFRSRSRRA